MTLKDTIQNDMKAALLSGESGNRFVGDTLRNLKAAILDEEVKQNKREEGLSDIPLIVGGIIPPEDEKLLRAEGVAAVYTPKDYELNAIMADIVRIVEGETKSTFS